MLEKAVIRCQKDEHDSELSKIINIKFNPATYKVTRNVSYSNAKDKENTLEYNNIELKNYPTMNFLGGQADTLNLDLVLNKYEFSHYSRSVDYTSADLNITDDVKEIEALTLIKPNLHRPPLCRFSWSAFEFQGYVTSFSAEYTMFLNDGTPVRAKISLTIQGAELGNDIQVPYESPDRTKIRVLEENQQLWEIAYEEYNDASKWREIARANNISNPLYPETGSKLIIPALKKL